MASLFQRNCLSLGERRLDHRLAIVLFYAPPRYEKGRNKTVEQTNWTYAVFEKRYVRSMHTEDLHHDNITYSHNLDDVSESLNIWGEDGWEVISVIEKSGGTLLFTLKKPIASI